MKNRIKKKQSTPTVIKDMIMTHVTLPHLPSSIILRSSARENTRYHLISHNNLTSHTNPHQPSTIMVKSNIILQTSIHDLKGKLHKGILVIEILKINNIVGYSTCFECFYFNKNSYYIIYEHNLPISTLFFKRNTKTRNRKKREKGRSICLRLISCFISYKQQMQWLTKKLHKRC
jgi:hypothetical protein